MNALLCGERFIGFFMISEKGLTALCLLQKHSAVRLMLRLCMMVKKPENWRKTDFLKV